MKAQFDFDREQHIYTLGGRRLPSVTDCISILNKFDRIAPDVLQAAADFGKNVHAACDLINRDELEWKALDRQLLPYALGWKQFLDDTGCVVLASEQPVVNEQFGYAGTPDCVLHWPTKKRAVIPDIKSTAAVPRTVGPQTVGYAKAYQAMYGGAEPLRYCVHLLGNGRYKLYPLIDPADWSIFLSCLNIRKFLNG